MATYWTDATFIVGAEERAETVVTTDDGWIEAVGDHHLLRDRGPQDRVESLAGDVVTPGLWDSHLHLAALAEERLTLALADTGSRADVVERVAARVRTTPAGGWIVGAGWHQDAWADGRAHYAALDAVSPHHPVALWARDRHSVWLNSEALRRVSAGLPGASTLRERDRHGWTGVLRESLATRVWDVIPAPNDKDLVAAFHEVARDLAAHGLVGGTGMEPTAAWRWLRSAPVGPLQFQVFLMAESGRPGEDDELAEILSESSRAESPSGPVKLVGRKFILDGAVGSRTAWLHEPYDDDPSQCGEARWDLESFRATLAALFRSGWSAAVHAIGDRAVASALTAWQGLSWHSTVLARIEHAQITTPDIRQRLAALGLGASMQPVHLLEDRVGAHAALGPRAAWSFACRSLWELGVPVLLGSDAPVASYDPVLGMQAAVSRGRPGDAPWVGAEALTPWQALQGYTSVPARADGRGSGRIEAGAPATFTRFDASPLAALAEGRPFRVTGTVHRGKRNDPSSPGPIERRPRHDAPPPTW